MIAGTVELAEADRVLYGLLGGDAALAELVGPNVYPHVAPPELEAAPAGGIPAAFVVWTLLTPIADVHVIGATGRVLVAADYTVKAVGEGPAPLRLEPIAARIDALLEGATIDRAGHRWLAQRVQPVHYPEVVAGRLHWHLGGIYRLEAA